MYLYVSGYYRVTYEMYPGGCRNIFGVVLREEETNPNLARDFCV
jgi:hypothetical protein